MSVTTPDVDYDLELELARGRLDGSLIRAKARMLLDDMGMKTLAQILTVPGLGATPKEQIEAIKVLAEIGDMKPKVAQMPAGPGVTIQFIRSDGEPMLPGVSHAPHTSRDLILIRETADTLPPIPAACAAMTLMFDLAGPPLETSPDDDD